MKVRIWVDWMASNIVAALAKEGHLSNQELQMVTPMNLVTEKAVLWNRRVLKGKGPSLFGMALVTEIVYRISPQHCFHIRCTHRIMAVRAFYSAFSDWMVGLFIGLSPYSLVASEAEVRLSDFQHTLPRPSRMDGVAVHAGNIHRFMFAQIPEWHIL
jgi:hypothetical protein